MATALGDNMKEYSTKEMKAGEPEIVKEEVVKSKKATIENKRGRYYVKNHLNGEHLQVFLSEKEAKEYIEKL